jgi:hypothetical protein
VGTGTCLEDGGPLPGRRRQRPGAHGEALGADALPATGPNLRTHLTPGHAQRIQPAARHHTALLLGLSHDAIATGRGQ